MSNWVACSFASQDLRWSCVPSAMCRSGMLGARGETQAEVYNNKLCDLGGVASGARYLDACEDAMDVYGVAFATS